MFLAWELPLILGSHPPRSTLRAAAAWAVLAGWLVVFGWWLGLVGLVLHHVELLVRR